MFITDHCVSGSQRAAQYDRLLLHLNSTVIAALISKQACSLDAHKNRHPHTLDDSGDVRVGLVTIYTPPTITIECT